MKTLDSRIRPVLPRDTARIVSVSAVDPSSGVRYHLRGDRLFHAASTMKVPVMIEVFRRVESGELSLDDEIVLRNEFRSIVDGTPFAIGDDTDDAMYERLGSPMSVLELTESMIRMSSNLATNLLIDEIGADSVQATSERLGTREMITLRGVEDLKAFDRGLSNRASSSDLALLMEAIMTGSAVSPQASRRMRDILLTQHFSDMIPAGLPDTVRVAHKTGRIAAVQHDAAIVLPPDGEPYVLVVMTEGFEDASESAALVARIAEIVHDVLRPGGGV